VIENVEPWNQGVPLVIVVSLFVPSVSTLPVPAPGATP